jgi:hypothetical protein
MGQSRDRQTAPRACSGCGGQTGYSQKEMDAMSAEEYRIKVLVPPAMAIAGRCWENIPGALK